MSTETSNLVSDLTLGTTGFTAVGIALFIANQIVKQLRLWRYRSACCGRECILVSMNSSPTTPGSVSVETVNAVNPPSPPPSPTAAELMESNGVVKPVSTAQRDIALFCHDAYEISEKDELKALYNHRRYKADSEHKYNRETTFEVAQEFLLSVIVKHPELMLQENIHKCVRKGGMGVLDKCGGLCGNLACIDNEEEFKDVKAPALDELAAEAERKIQKIELSKYAHKEWWKNRRNNTSGCLGVHTVKQIGKKSKNAPYEVRRPRWVKDEKNYVGSYWTYEEAVAVAVPLWESYGYKDVDRTGTISESNIATMV